MVTRAEFISHLMKAIRKTENIDINNIPFDDVTGNEWYATYIKNALYNNIIGTAGIFNSENFNSYTQITYQEAIVYQMRALGYRDYLDETSTLEKYIVKATELNLTDDLYFFLTGYICRRDEAIFLYNLLDIEVLGSNETFYEYYIK
jgi:hypothetical protein